MKNLVHQLKIELSFPSSETQLTALNRTIDGEFRDSIVKAISEVIEKTTPTHTVFIDKIEICATAENTVTLIKLIKEQVENEILRVIESEKTISELAQIDSSEKIWDFQCLSYFLSTGLFLWEEQKVVFKENPEKIDVIIDKYLNERFLELLQFFAKKPYAFIRFVNFFGKTNQQFLHKIAYNFNYFQQDIETVLQQLLHLEPYQYDVNKISTLAYFFELCTAPKNKEQSFEALLTLTSIISKKGFLISTFFDKKLQNKADYEKLLLKTLKEVKQKNFTFSADFYEYFAQRAFNFEASTTKNMQKYHSKVDTFKAQNISELPDNLRIANAGLVLLHPFFEFLFDEYKLLNQGKFIDKKSQFKAVQLLHYLATYENDFTEDEVILNKILCGLSIDEPICILKKLSKKEKNSCRELLTQAIAYWEILKNTSPEALQQDFIQRHGTLAIENKQILITVEKQTIDILLQRLPWGIGFIKLTWNESMINVNWD